MIDRNVRFRLLLILDLMQKYDKWFSVQDIITLIRKTHDNWFQVERRAIYADWKALEEFGYVTIENRAHNKRYAKANIFYMDETLQPERVQERTLPEAKQDKTELDRCNCIKCEVLCNKTGEQVRNKIYASV